MAASKGKYVLKGHVENITPLHIGSGNDDRSDMDIVKNSDGIPFIPATAFTGVLLHSLRPSLPSEIIKKEEWKRFWGNTDKKEQKEKGRGTGYESRFRCSDLNIIDNTSNPTSFAPVIRDGVKIDNTRNMAADKSKFDYELLEPGLHFSLNAEFSFTDSDREFVEIMIRTIIWCLTEGDFFIGKMSNAGFGRIHLIPDTTTLYQFDFDSKTNDNAKDDALAWLYQDFSKKEKFSYEKLPPPYTIQPDIFRIYADFQLKHSLIVRSYSADPKAPDAVHLTSGNKNVIPGTSLKGAIRARAERIANTINPDRSEKLIQELFGSDIKQPEKRPKKGRVRIKEIVLPDYPSQNISRIRIDRFTGGVIDGGLFETKPVFSNDNSLNFTLEIAVADTKSDEVDREAGFGILLLVLKDLWSGDLAVGGEKNVGRGVLKGVQATVCYNGEEMIIPEDINRMDYRHKTRLEGFVKEFNKWMESGQ